MQLFWRENAAKDFPFDHPFSDRPHDTDNEQRFPSTSSPASASSHLIDYIGSREISLGFVQYLAFFDDPPDDAVDLRDSSHFEIED